MVAILRDAALVIVAIGAWCAWCWFWPIKRCRRCEGRKGRGVGSTQHGYSRCRKCKGSGEQVRWTAALISKFTGWPIRGMEK
jgi:hypothetical protein